MAEADPYADFSDAQLLEELEEMEREEEEGAAELGDELAPVDASLDVDVSSPEEQLEAWNEFVKDFGGRIASPAKRTLLQELSLGQLGQRIFLPTTQAFPLFETVLLAEVNLSQAMPMDVTFNYSNMRPEALDAPLDQGSGFVRLTWGSPGTFKRTADVDGNRGWRRQFSASFMRVEYVPVPTPAGFNTIPGSQPRDLGVAAMISPAIGSVSEQLTKTVFFGDIAAMSSRSELIPRWATNVRIAGSFNNLSADYTVLLTDATVFSVQTFGSDGTQAPFLESIIAKFPVPQRAQRIFILLGPASSVNRATAIFELAL